MACIDAETSAALSRPDYHYEDIARIQGRLNKVTAMLCRVMVLVEHNKGSVDLLTDLGLDHELQEWWNKHKEEDKARKEIEALSKKYNEEYEKKKDLAEHTRLKQKLGK